MGINMNHQYAIIYTVIVESAIVQYITIKITLFSIIHHESAEKS